MIKKYHLIGSPVAHSLSPLIYHTLFARYGLSDCTYSVLDVTRETLPAFVGQISAEGICGFNVTTPLKAEMLKYIDKTGPRVHGGVNTVAVADGRLYGDSTDAAGFARSLAAAGSGYRGRNIVMIGYGAVSGALLYDMAAKGAKKITVVNRTLSKLQNLSRQMNRAVVTDHIGNIAAHMADCDLLVNTTPVGMAHVGAGYDYSFLSGLPKKAYVCDLIYDPLETPLLQAARQNGNSTLNGLGMLVWQAFYSFEKFFGTLPGQEDYNAVMQAVKKR